MSVELHPSSQLGFQRPFDRIVKRILQVTNPHAQPVAFKVKTTAPKLYCVRPNSGRIEAGETVDVSVLLQPMKEEPPLSAKCKDKFLVQTTFITPDREKGTINDLWAVAEKASDENRIHQQKIKVAYLPAEGDALLEEPEQSLTMTDNSMLQSFATVRQAPLTNGHASIVELDHPFSPVVVPQAPHEPLYAEEEQGEYNIAHEEPRQEIHAEEPEPPIAPAVLAAPPSAPEVPHHAPVEVKPATSSKPHEPVAMPSLPTGPKTEDPDAGLLAKYADAQAEIERLRTVLATYAEPAMPNVGLRRRGHRGSDDGETNPSDETQYADTQFLQSTDGVPPLVVIMIALGVFITTYLFF